MKALILSDLHINQEYYNDIFGQKKYKKILENQIKEDFDIVLIAGDVFEHRIMNTKQNPFDILNFLFDEKEVVFCLGNHEFAYEHFNDVMKYWSKFSNNNIHCLDVCNNVVINNVNFVGNVFWYDFSLNKNPMLMKGEIVDGWLDATIKEFDPIKENEINKNKILKSIDENRRNILITHMVPHWLLNSFSIDQEMSLYNAYSGNYDFLKEIKNKNIEYAICGHTHRRECKDIYGIHCINIGNDYYFKTNRIEYMIIEI